MQEEYSQLLARYTEPFHRKLVDSSDHSGDWLHVLTIAACGLHLDNEAIRVAVDLRLECILFASHSHACRCGATVDTLAWDTLHAFSCQQNITSKPYVNDVI